MHVDVCVCVCLCVRVCWPCKLIAYGKPQMTITATFYSSHLELPAMNGFMVKSVRNSAKMRWVWRCGKWCKKFKVQIFNDAMCVPAYSCYENSFYSTYRLIDTKLNYGRTFFGWFGTKTYCYHYGTTLTNFSPNYFTHKFKTLTKREAKKIKNVHLIAQKSQKILNIVYKFLLLLLLVPQQITEFSSLSYSQK